MNWQNLPGQLLALFLGWSFTVYFQYVSNRRAEALKRKDKIIDKLDDLSGWIESEISKEDFSLTDTETSYSGMVSHIELRVRQLNSHVGRQILDPNELSILREIEIHSSLEFNKRLPYVVREASSDVIERVEAECDREYFGQRGFLQFLNNYIQDLAGILMTLVSFLLVAAIAQFLVKYVF
jgi:hypothetical protein